MAAGAAWGRDWRRLLEAATTLASSFLSRGFLASPRAPSCRVASMRIWMSPLRFRGMASRGTLKREVERIAYS